MLKEIQGEKTALFHDAEDMIRCLRESEDQAINQFINGKISLDSYCKWLVGREKGD